MHQNIAATSTLRCGDATTGTEKDGDQGTHKVRNLLSVRCMVYRLQCSFPHQLHPNI